VAALSAYITDRASKWVFLAGLSGGLSFLVKVAALYYVLGAFLFFLFLEQSTDKDEDGKRRTFIYSTCAVAALLLVSTMVVRLVHTRPSVEAYVSLMLPAAVGYRAAPLELRPSAHR